MQGSRFRISRRASGASDHLAASPPTWQVSVDQDEELKLSVTDLEVFVAIFAIYFDWNSHLTQLVKHT
jgi:hypothetical protein